MAKQPKKNKGNNFLVQGSILAIAGIVVRLIGLLYRVPLMNTIGEDGMGVYSTAFSIYNILLLISSYSLPLAVSRLVAARISLGQYKNARRVFQGALMFATASGVIMCSITWFGSNFFADLMKMPEAAYAIRVLAPCILIMAFLGVFRGYFQGHGTMVPTATSQIAEQVFNAVVSVAAGYMLFKAGTERDLTEGTEGFYSAAYGASGGTLGTVTGAGIALLFFIVLYFSFRKVEDAKCRRDKHENRESYGYILKIVIMTILPVLFSTTIYQISSVLDQGIYAQSVSDSYASVWGAYSSKYLLMIHVPTAIASSMGSSIIPALAAAISRGNKTEIIDKTGTAIRFNMVIAIPASIGLAVLAGPIMNLLFSGDNSVAIHMMLIGSTMVMFNALSTISNSVLQGIGNIWIPVKNALIALVLHIGILAFMLWVLDLGIDGVVLSNVVFYIMMCVFNQLSIRHILQYRQEYIKTFVCPLFSSAVMGLAASILYRVIHALIHSNMVSLLLSILVAVVVYAVLMLLTKGIDEVDLASFPKGRTLVAIAKKLHLLGR